MTKQQKSEIIDSLTSEFKESQAIVVCDYKGLTHKELESLRIDAKANNTKVQVAKNTLVAVSVKNADLGDIELSGTNVFLWSEDQISACKVADTFAMAKKEKFVIFKSSYRNDCNLSLKILSFGSNRSIRPCGP